MFVTTFKKTTTGWFICHPNIEVPKSLLGSGRRIQDGIALATASEAYVNATCKYRLFYIYLTSIILSLSLQSWHLFFFLLKRTMIQTFFFFFFFAIVFTISTIPFVDDIKVFILNTCVRMNYLKKKKKTRYNSIGCFSCSVIIMRLESTCSYFLRVWNLESRGLISAVQSRDRRHDSEKEERGPGRENWAVGSSSSSVSDYY